MPIPSATAVKAVIWDLLERHRWTARGHREMTATEAAFVEAAMHDFRGGLAQPTGHELEARLAAEPGLMRTAGNAALTAAFVGRDTDDLVALLVAKGARFEYDRNEWSPLHSAAHEISRHLAVPAEITKRNAATPGGAASSTANVPPADHPATPKHQGATRPDAADGATSATSRIARFQTVFEAELAGAAEIAARPLHRGTVGHRSLLHVASFFGHWELAELLLDHGAHAVLERRIGRNGHTALQCATEMHYWRERRERTAEALLGRGAYYDIFSACARNDSHRLRQLLRQRGAVDERNKQGETPLHWAAWCCASQCVELLLAAGANVNATAVNGKTPLHLAAGPLDAPEGWPRPDNPAVVDMLIRHGAAVDAGDSRGRTPLHHAAFRGYSQAAERLLEAGADATQRNRRGKTAFDIARKGAKHLRGRPTAAKRRAVSRLGQGGLLLWLAGFTILGATPGQAQESRLVPLFPAAADQRYEGFVRVVNHDEEDGEVRIVGFDDSGWRTPPVTLELAAGKTGYFNSRDFESGEPSKGLPEGVGPPREGSWRLELSSPLDVEVNAYIRTPDGFLTSAHDVAPQVEGTHRIAFFNPGSNAAQRSRLRLLNLGDAAVEVTIRGVDDHGRASEDVRVAVPAHGARTFEAADLEAGVGVLDGALGDGVGKWRLTVSADAAIRAMGLLASPTGHLTNLSAGAAAARNDGGLRRHLVPFFPAAPATSSAASPAAASRNQGFVRIVNRGAAGTARITAIDDAGDTAPVVTLAIGAGQTVHFNSTDLQNGNPRKGLSGGVGPGVGDWRLQIRTSLPELQVYSFMRNTAGFVTSMRDLAPTATDALRVAFFNPGSNQTQRSVLRLVNFGAAPATVTLTGMDDDGEPSGEAIVRVPARGARRVGADALEVGTDITGALGDGRGKWRLTASSNQPIAAMSLLASPNGPTTNLSNTTRETAADIFRATVAAPVVDALCAQCHVTGGDATDTRLIFRVAAADNHVERNRRALARFFRTATDAPALLLEKPLGLRGHGGGAQLEATSPEYANLRRFVAAMEAETTDDDEPGAPLPLLDAIPTASGSIDPRTRQVNVVHTGEPGTAYAYADPCPFGVAMRHALPAAGDSARQVVDHKLECDFQASATETVRVAGRDPDGARLVGTLPLTTTANAAEPSLVVRASRAIAQDDVNELFDRYIAEALIEDIEGAILQLLAAVLIDELARRTWAELRNPGARYDVVTRRVSYTSRQPSGVRAETATGLVAMPEISTAPTFTRKPSVVVLSHATGSTPSELDFRDAWYAVAGMLAGRGYLVVAADNWGRGELAPQGQPETYLMVNRTANNSADLLTAVLASEDYRAFHDPDAEETDVSIIGYSQGAHSAVALWLELHTRDHGVRVRELHSGAGPHNLRQTFIGALQHLAGQCDGNEWCQNVDTEVVLPYVVGRIVPALLAYTTTGLARTDILDGNNVRPDFVAGMLRQSAEYETLHALLELNSHTGLIAPASVVRSGTAINLYHSEYDLLVPEANTRQLAELLAAADFDVTYHDEECESTDYRRISNLIDKPGTLHVVCGLEVVDDVLKRFP